MSLTDRLVHRKPDGTGAGDIPIHEFTAAVSLYAYGLAAKNEITTLFGLEADDIADLDSLAAMYTSLSSEALKAQYLNRLECAGLFYQNGKIDAARYKSIMGF